MIKGMDEFMGAMKNTRVSSENELKASKIHRELNPMIDQVTSEVTDLMNDKKAQELAGNHEEYVRDRSEKTKDIISKHYPTAKKVFEDTGGFRDWEASAKAVELLEEVVKRTLELELLSRLTSSLFGK